MVVIKQASTKMQRKGAKGNERERIKAIQDIVK